MSFDGRSVRKLRNEFTAVIEKEDDWYIAYCPEIPGANGQGTTVDAAARIWRRLLPLSSTTGVRMDFEAYRLTRSAKQ